MISIGPLALPLGLVAVLSGYGLLLWLGGRLLPDRHRQFSTAALRALLIGGLGARLVYVLDYRAEYFAQPWSILNIRDQGFAPWAGLALAAAVLAGFALRHPALRRAVAIATLGAGAAFVGVLGIGSALLERKLPPLPATQLATLDGQSLNLAEQAGQPLVINLWATWCPPCRREMPTLTQAQSRYADVRFVLANQGEDATTVRRYLETAELDMRRVVLDPDMALGRHYRSSGLPTTLFVDASGHVAHVHYGEISNAGIARGIAAAR
ncbi:MAG: TlpA disulfide reductase family protein [Nevskiales bacterium]|nr:TlpA disulfide reductase family protein [Nevskiales bacterium]